jgi:hypothetical protein
MTVNTDWVPAEIDTATMIFPASVSHLMPDYGDIHAEFKMTLNPWAQLQSTWFFFGLSADSEFFPKDGIDPKAALRHLKAIQGSFEPKHEHKSAAVAFLLSLWFEQVRYAVNGKTVVAA